MLEPCTLTVIESFCHNYAIEYELLAKRMINGTADLETLLLCEMYVDIRV